MWLWYANRGTGVVLMMLLTLSTALGVLATARAGTPTWPRFATQNLHRNVALMSAALLVAHAATPIMDGFVDLRWYHVFVPFGGDYVRKNRLPMGLAAFAFDLILVTVVTSLARHRLPHRLWRGLHLLTYVAWAAGTVHGLLLGTDQHTGWGQAVTVACVAVVVVAALIRIGIWVNELRRRPSLRARRVADPS